MKPDTKAIRARADAATKGPWLIIVEALRSRVDCERISGWADETVCRLEQRDPPDVNGDFVAAARTDVPVLCDRVEALEAALAEALELADWANRTESRRVRLEAVRDTLEGK